MAGRLQKTREIKIGIEYVGDEYKKALELYFRSF